MKVSFLIRICTGDQGTFGNLCTSGFQCVIGELPWRNNEEDISCIPQGIYRCEIVKSPKFGIVYTIKNVPKRGLIRIHSGNLVGDMSLGYITHSLGCPIIGKYFGYLDNQKAVLNSRPTLRKFMSHMEYEPFILYIVNRY